MRGLLLLFALAATLACQVAQADPCDRYRATLTREAQAVLGIGAPIPALAGQLMKESSCRADVTAWDDGRGLAQFMDPTAEQVSRLFPELGAPDPYNPTWAMRGQVRFNRWLGQRVKAVDECHRWAAVFKGYNAGLGYVQRAQRVSPEPGVWFGVTEHINAGQSLANFQASRQYPRKIIFSLQRRYASWGPLLCTGVTA